MKKEEKMKVVSKSQAKIRIVSKDQAFWEEIQESTKKDIERLEKLLKFQKNILWLTKTKLKNIKR